jgi:hypothetical protein
MLIYNNIPKKTIANSANSTKTALANFYENDLPMNDADYTAMLGFFESRGFSSESSATITYIMFLQAKIDGYNPFDVLSTVKNLSGTELTALVTEILNFNRFKSSFLGLAATYSTQPEVQKEILP